MTPIANSEKDQEETLLETYGVDDENISAEEFVKRLIEEGSKCPHDNRSAFVGTKEDLPKFYNETMFRKGQDFFQKHILGIFLGSFIATFAGLSQPSGKVLVMTKKTSTPLTAYRRYGESIMHVCTWYESDFEPGSKLWSSVNKIRKMHSAISIQSQSRLNYLITQYDMSVIIVALMGIPLIRGQMVGIYDASEDEFKCFIHFWKVIGYLFGIEDRFNICRDSVKLTREITTLWFQKDLFPKMKVGGPHVEILTKAFIEGMQGIFPVLNYDQIINHVHLIIDSISDSDTFEQLASPGKTSNWSLMGCIVRIMKFDFGRIILNSFLRMTFWLLRVFPVFAYFKFGIKNSHVKI